MELLKIIEFIELGIMVCGLLCSALFTFRKIRTRNKEHDVSNVIRQPTQWPIIGLVLTVGMILLVVIGIIFRKPDVNLEEQKENCAFISMFLVLILAGEIYFPQALIWEVRIFDDRFIYTGAFGRKRTCFYDGIKIIRRITDYKGKNVIVNKYYYKGRRILALNSMTPNYYALRVAIERFMGERIYNLPMKQWYIDVEALRREEMECLESASERDRMIYDRLIEKLKTGDEITHISDFIGEIKDTSVLPYFEETVLSWDNKKLQALTAYIAGNKENRKACDTVVKAYLSLSYEDKKRYASLFDKAIRCTITKNYVLSNLEWLADWHVAFNLPKTVEKIGKGNLPEINQMWLTILKQKNKLDNEYYDFEDAKKVLLPIVKRNMV